MRNHLCLAIATALVVLVAAPAYACGSGDCYVGYNKRGGQQTPQRGQYAGFEYGASSAHGQLGETYANVNGGANHVNGQLDFWGNTESGALAKSNRSGHKAGNVSSAAMAEQGLAYEREGWAPRDRGHHAARPSAGQYAGIEYGASSAHGQLGETYANVNGGANHVNGRLDFWGNTESGALARSNRYGHEAGNVSSAAMAEQGLTFELEGFRVNR